ncbi:hypothetical protein PENSPDRAFT_635398 [Peniophora sp. CONT]|nr:hypothetical protein PENSPDRAFT_635398 [Peniophora sp. CONT]
MSDSTRTQETYFHYKPKSSTAVFFLLWFSAATVAHIYLSIKHRMRFLIWTAGLCGMFEVIGWLGRLIASRNTDSPSLIPYLLNSLFTLFGPTPLLGANFIMLGMLITRLGPCYSRLGVRKYSRIFLSCDCLAMFIQMSGGGLSAIDKFAKLGGTISLVGIIFQLLALIVYAALGTEFLVRYLKRNPFENHTKDQYYRGELTKRVKMLVGCMVFMTFLIFVRSVYRSAELAGGFDGPITHNEKLFIIFDAVMILLALSTLVILHPSRLLIRGEEASTMLYPSQPSESQTYLQDGYATSYPPAHKFLPLA